MLREGRDKEKKEVEEKRENDLVRWRDRGGYVCYSFIRYCFRTKLCGKKFKTNYFEHRVTENIYLRFLGKMFIESHSH